MRRLLLLVLLNCGAFSAYAESPFTFEVSHKLLREEYWTDEPIAVEFTIKNTSAKPIEIHGRDSFWVHFKCGDPSILKRKSLKGIWEDVFYNGLISVVELTPGESMSGVRFVNFEFDYRKPGNFDVTFSLHLSYTYKGLPPKNDRLELKQTGELKISVKEKALTQERLNPLLERWKDDRISQRQVMQGLSLVEDPFVIPLLMQYAREAPWNAKTAAVALRRFISTQEGQDALESLAREFMPDDTYKIDEYNIPKERDYAEFTLGCVLQSFRITERFPSERFLREQLRSSNIDRVRKTLEFLLECQQLGNQAPVEELERLLLQQNKQLSEQAEKVLEKVSKQKVDVQF